MSEGHPATVGHPSPHGHRVGFVTLMFGFWGGPIAWIGQLLLSYGLSSTICYPGRIPLTAVSGAFRWLTPALLAIDAIALVIALTAAVVSWRAFAITREEMEGDHHHLLEVGEGRSRFLAICGLATSAGFFIVIAFNTLSLILVPLCAR